MRELSATTHLIKGTENGPILEVRVSGNVESRQGGITTLVESSLSGIHATGVVFDLSNLRYTSWDDVGILGIVAATNGFTRPCCVLSMGRNNKSLCDLLNVTGLSEFLGGQVFSDRGAAVDHIFESLRKGTA